MVRVLLLAIAFLLVSFPLHAQSCNSRMLVSGFSSNNVHVYDGCDGTFQRLLDGSGRIAGAQALVTDRDGFLYLASEGNGRIIRYREDLGFDSIVADAQGNGVPVLGVSSPTGLALGPDGDLYVAGFEANRVVRLDPATGRQKAEYALGTIGIDGPDAGLVFHPDGRLLVPGFTSNDIAAIDVDAGTVSIFVEAGAGGLRNPRVIRYESALDRFVVSSWGSGRLLAFDRDGNFLEELIRTGNPTGFARLADGAYLVATDRTPIVSRYSAEGQIEGQFITNGAGGLDGATFVTLLGEPEGDDDGSSAGPEQAWLIGVGEFADLVLSAPMVITDGARFGDVFDPANVTREVWGEVQFELLSCETGRFAFESVDPTFGAGGYDMIRVAPNGAQAACEAGELGSSAAAGTWFGGAEKDGEGIMIDVLDESTGVITWYTYRP